MNAAFGQKASKPSRRCEASQASQRALSAHATQRRVARAVS
jgi:hypothetical protein